MAPFSLVTASAGLLSKSFSVFSCSSSLARCTSVIPTSCVPFRCLSSQSSTPPKKPHNVFVRFFLQQRPVLLRQNLEFSVADVMKKSAALWRTMNPEQKRPFVEAYMQEKEKFEADLKRYKAQLTPAQIQQQTLEHREKLAKRNSIRRKKEIIDMGRPKHIRTSFAIFISENFREAKGVGAVAKLKSMADRWNSLLDHQKQVYRQLAEDDIVRYKNEMKTWEEHMVEIGREDLTHAATPKQKAVGKNKINVKTLKTTKKA